MSLRALIHISESTLKEISKAEGNKDSPDPKVFDAWIQVKNKIMCSLHDSSRWWQEYKGSNKHLSLFMMEKRICWWKAKLFVTEKRRKQVEMETRAEMKDWVMSDQVDHCMDDWLLVQHMICNGPTLHATVTGAPVWLPYTNPCDHLLNKNGCATQAENRLSRSVVSIRHAEAVSYGEGKDSSCKHCVF